MEAGVFNVDLWRCQETLAEARGCPDDESTRSALVRDLVTVLALISFVLPVLLVRPHKDLDRAKLLKARHDVRTVAVPILGGAALLAGLVFTNRTLALNQQDRSQIALRRLLIN